MGNSEVVQVLCLVALLPEVFGDGAILGGSMALGEHLVLRRAAGSGP